MRSIILYFVMENKGEWEKVYRCICDKVPAIPNKYNYKNYISIVDSESYPKQYRDIYKPPFTIFYYGNKSLLYKENYISLYGMVSDKEKIKEIKSYNIIYLVDYKNKKLINELLKNNINFIACSESGITEKDKNSLLYKKIIENNNLIITEIPDNSNVKYENQFFWRIILALSKNILFLSNENKKVVQSIIELACIEDFECFSIVKIDSIFVKQCKDISYFCSKKTLS